MPELPEVEVTRRYLLSLHVQGHSITGVTLDWEKAVKKPSPEEFVKGLEGREIEDVGRRGKFLLFILDVGVLIVHLRMTGALIAAGPEEPAPRFVRTTFKIDDGRRLFFADSRKLGMMWLTDDTSAVIGKLGPEPLSDSFTPQVLAGRLRRRNVPVKALLLEQDVVAGLGNIYADEALFLAGIHPMKNASELTDKNIENLHGTIKGVLSEATEKLTALLPRPVFVTELGEGSMVVHMPRTEGAYCLRCGSTVKRKVIRGRSAYFCTRCQSLR